jgi:ATP-binding cassette subfamily B protein
LEPQIANPVPRWKDRLNALRNTLPIFRMVWEASPRIVVANVSVRLIVSLLPLAMLAVTKVIIDSIYGYRANHTALPTYFWWLVVIEFALACISTILVRVTDYCDTVLADNSKYVSVRIMHTHRVWISLPTKIRHFKTSWSAPACRH